MLEEPPPLLPPAEESIEAGTDTALEPEPEARETHARSYWFEPDFVCACEEWMRSACKKLSFYGPHEGRRYCVLHYPGKEKSADFRIAFVGKLERKDFDFRGVWFPDEVRFRGFEFGVDANFSQAKFNAVTDFSRATFVGCANFAEVTFTTLASFAGATFSGAVDFAFATFMSLAQFHDATFTAAADFSVVTFGALANFVKAKFSADADFTSAHFETGGYFSYAAFSAGASFSDATFSAAADFTFVQFSAAAHFTNGTFGSNANFSHTVFSAAAEFGVTTFSADTEFDGTLFQAEGNFRRATFAANVRFFGVATEGVATERELKDGALLAPMALGNNPSLDFQHARVEQPDRVAFHTLILCPHWFVNVDSRKFVFTDVSWEWEHSSIDDEIAALKAKEVSSPKSLLAIACRQLAENAEANNRYEEASKFRYWAMNLARRIKWKGWRFWKTDWLHVLYGAVSGYGERILRPFGVLTAVWFVFVLLYTQVGFAQQQPSNATASSSSAASMNPEDRTGQPLEFSRALTYSLAVMSLQKPEPKPLTGTAQTLVLLETILGPVQAALLALAIRRKFMR